MKQNNEKKLSLNKITIQDLQLTLNRDELKTAHGGSAANPPGITQIVVYC